MDYDAWEDRPIPAIDPESEPYWRAAADGRLVVQRCGSCGERQLYPRRLCRHCWSRDLADEALPGSGTLYSWTTCHVPGQPGYGGDTPYVVALVDLDLPAANPSGRPVRLTSHVTDRAGEQLAAPDALTMGLSLRAAFEGISIEPTVRLPVFVPSD